MQQSKVLLFPAKTLTRLSRQRLVSPRFGGHQTASLSVDHYVLQAKMYFHIANQACDARSFPLAAKYVKQAKVLLRMVPGAAGMEMERLVLQQVWLCLPF